MAENNYIKDTSKIKICPILSNIVKGFDETDKSFIHGLNQEIEKIWKYDGQSEKDQSKHIEIEGLGHLSYRADVMSTVLSQRTNLLIKTQIIDFQSFGIYHEGHMFLMQKKENDLSLRIEKPIPELVVEGYIGKNVSDLIKWEAFNGVTAKILKSEIIKTNRRPNGITNFKCALPELKIAEV